MKKCAKVAIGLIAVAVTGKIIYDVIKEASDEIDNLQLDDLEDAESKSEKAESKSENTKSESEKAESSEFDDNLDFDEPIEWSVGFYKDAWGN